MNIDKEFKDKGYVYLKDIYDINKCRNLTKHLESLVEKGLTTNDTQCPTSEAVYGDSVFDELLKELLPEFEKVSGKKLNPTYSYARLYKKGEELKVHKDRESCEISATLTLDYSGKPWAIYMGDNEDKTNASEIYMKVGDAVLYRGMDKWHWREKFEGEWQAQVFLHYVDADGPHANLKYDNRTNLGLQEVQDKNLLPTFTYFQNHFSSIQCDEIIKSCTGTSIEYEKPVVGNSGTERIDTNVRNVKRLQLPFNNGIGGILTSVGLNANNALWKFNVTHTEQTEFLLYEPNGHYVGHVDTEYKHSFRSRKLTVLVFLNDDYEGGKFWINPEGVKFYPPQEKGTVLVFPSYIVHGVEPVTKGTRYSCVTWMLGDYFK